MRMMMVVIMIMRAMVMVVFMRTIVVVVVVVVIMVMSMSIAIAAMAIIVHISEGIIHVDSFSCLKVDDRRSFRTIASAASTHQAVSNSIVLILSSSPRSRAD